MINGNTDGIKRTIIDELEALLEAYRIGTLSEVGR